MVFQAIAYIVYTGCQWRMLPMYYPRPTTVYYHFRKWNESYQCIKFLRRLVWAGRKKRGRRRCPTTGILDSQSVRSGFSQSHKGIDGFKRIKGIKMQVLVDSNGFPVLIDVTTANVHDSKGIDNILVYYPSISLIKADKSYRSVDTTPYEFELECVKSNFGTSEFRPISGTMEPHRTLKFQRKTLNDWPPYV